MLARATTAVLLFSFLSCTTLRPVGDANVYLANSRPGHIWVRTIDETWVVEAPRLIGDTLVGFVDGEYREFLPGAVREVRVREPAPRRTVFLTAGMIAVGAFLIATLASTGPGGRLPTPEDDPTNTNP